ncbi:hypothetical protein HDU92_000362 [Lobulomyces angularis]|nr:hypothetical protein HDU92_000362 [Lobulomyces angularis]
MSSIFESNENNFVNARQYLSTLATKPMKQYQPVDSNKLTTLPTRPSKPFVLNHKKPSNPKINLKIKILKPSKTFEVQVAKFDTVKLLKSFIFEKEPEALNKNLVSIRLLFKGKPLLDENSFNDYDLRDNDTVNLVIKQKGIEDSDVKEEDKDKLLASIKKDFKKKRVTDSLSDQNLDKSQFLSYFEVKGSDREFWQNLHSFLKKEFNGNEEYTRKIYNAFTESFLSTVQPSKNAEFEIKSASSLG